MIKTTLSIIGLSLVSTLALAADPLHGSKWKTIDDVTKKPLSVVQFTETSKGVLSAKIVDVLEGTEGEKCTKCKGKSYNKPLQGVQIVSGLKKALHLLSPIDGIGVVHLTAEDVVRHRLVKEIIKAYQIADQKERARIENQISSQNGHENGINHEEE